ncbi:MAG: hypothetical protein A2068_14720 [Ignavibacteria bacterium GWB2_35_6b]|nr:MAG: hypothetical protein A2068_14720 [Ignavibacteria bacterium GWB2_35_6b]
MATKYPPQISISEAVRVVKEIYYKHNSKDISIDLMPEILKISPKSSYFPASITALQKFGLVEKRPNEILELTNLSMQIIEPLGDDEREQSISKLLRNDEVLSSLIDKYPNLTLPSEEQLKLTLIKNFNIPRETVSKWHQFVIDSFKEFHKNRSQNDSIISSFPEKIEMSNQIESKNKADLEIGKNKYQNFELPSGKKFSFSIDDGYNLEDIEFILDFFELKKKRMVKN